VTWCSWNRGRFKHRNTEATQDPSFGLGQDRAIFYGEAARVTGTSRFTSYMTLQIGEKQILRHLRPRESYSSPIWSGVLLDLLTYSIAALSASPSGDAHYGSAPAGIPASDGT
jgi:hypothetical protein